MTDTLMRTLTPGQGDGGRGHMSHEGWGRTTGIVENALQVILTHTPGSTELGKLRERCRHADLEQKRNKETLVESISLAWVLGVTIRWALPGRCPTMSFIFIFNPVPRFPQRVQFNRGIRFCKKQIKFPASLHPPPPTPTPQEMLVSGKN